MDETEKKPKFVFTEDQDDRDQNLRQDCYTCHSKNIILVKVNDFGVITKNYMAVCPNFQCHRHVDIKNFKSWVVRDESTKVGNSVHKSLYEDEDNL